MRLGSQSTVASIGFEQDAEVPMDTEKPATALKDADAGPGQLDQSGVKTTDDIEKGMTSEVLDTLHLVSRGAKYRLASEDMHKYTGVGNHEIC